MSCPICGKAAEEKYRPFCSKRCADIDLGRWLKGGYVIPATAQEEDEAVPVARRQLCRNGVSALSVKILCHPFPDGALAGT
ncbi:hypothetical protein GCM10007291_21930 [Gemmobacter nanjingensis]|uniref:DNA gyrase inhibitor YacG n=1 Tax=Gemmobacter nanjingensis TaxID=488454 RepID=A0ABQ3FGB2_9RHOB|nr:DNA gyrase inhibitor YacG [Gemmobacter nanjingensis]GHC22200.1 hypothetical protein GCM10007291_21930 [Gemmobacter nanjingensis]